MFRCGIIGCMKKVFFAVVILSVLALGGYFYASRDIYYVSETTSILNKTNDNSDSNIASSTSQKELEITDDVTQCASALRAETEKGGLQYEKGSILVSFDKTKDRATATAILDQYGFPFTIQSRDASNTQLWGTVTVPAGQEFIQVCNFKKNGNIRYAGINPILELHE